MKALLSMAGQYRYQRIDSTEQEEARFEKTAIRTLPYSLEPAPPTIDRSFWIHAQWIFFAFSLLLFLAFLYNIHYLNTVLSEHTNSYFLKQTSTPSPVLDDINLEVKRKQMDTTFVKQHSSYLLRKAPGPHVDAAWWSLLDTRPVPITRERVLEIGKDPSQSVKIPESWGHGNDMYFGRIGVFHHIHFLDTLRKEAYFEHYYGDRFPGGLNGTSDFHREHLSHCIYLLSQNVLCSANTDVYTHTWVDNLEHPWPDFEVNHQCKNFDAILERQKKNALEKAFSELVRLEGYQFRVASHRFREVNGWFDDHKDDGDLVSGRPA